MRVHYVPIFQLGKLLKNNTDCSTGNCHLTKWLKVSQKIFEVASPKERSTSFLNTKLPATTKPSAVSIAKENASQHLTLLDYLQEIKVQPCTWAYDNIWQYDNVTYI